MKREQVLGIIKDYFENTDDTLVKDATLKTEFLTDKIFAELEPVWEGTYNVMKIEVASDLGDPQEIVHRVAPSTEPVKVRIWIEDM